MASLFDLFHDDFFKNIMDFENEKLYYPDEKSCPQCNFKFRDFNKTGKLGCDKCYEVFSYEIEPIIKRIQGSTEYNGRVPNKGSGIFKIKQKIKKLRIDLNEAVKNENFEQASVIRDQIKELEKNLFA